MAAVVTFQGRCRRAMSLTEIKRNADRMLRALCLNDLTVSVLLCDDATIRRLNRKYARRDRATDVLSFSMREGAAILGAPRLLGDIVISLPTAIRQAKSNRRNLSEEVNMLLAHGLLHLLGFDHRSRIDRRRMDAYAVMLAAATARPSQKQK